MEFYYTVSEEKMANIDFKDIYNIQIDDLLNNCYFDSENIELAKGCLSDGFGDNIDYYLHRIGLADYNDCDNESVSDCIWQEYENWLNDNYNPNDFE